MVVMSVAESPSSGMGGGGGGRGRLHLLSECIFTVELALSITVPHKITQPMRMSSW